MEIHKLFGRVLLTEQAWASGWASATRWTNFQVRNFQTWTSGWASGTIWASMGQWLGEGYSLGE